MSDETHTSDNFSTMATRKNSVAKGRFSFAFFLDFNRRSADVWREKIRQIIFLTTATREDSVAKGSFSFAFFCFSHSAVFHSSKVRIFRKRNDFEKNNQWLDATSERTTLNCWDQHFTKELIRGMKSGRTNPTKVKLQRDIFHGD